MTKIKTLIIAEAGVNHNGDIKTAKKLIDAAVYSGANIIKFQTFSSVSLTTSSAIKSNYQIENTHKPFETQQEMLSNLELSKDNHFELIEYSQKNNIEFLSSAFDPKSVKFLDALNLKRWKIPSGEITNYPFLKFIGSKNKPVILSTGMSNMDEIEQALNILLESGCERKKITLLQCNSEYPTPLADVNLRVIQTMKKKFNVATGLSDHTIGIEIPIAAVALGATIIEKHLTLNRKMEGPDHKASIEPNEFKNLVNAIRNIEIALGDGYKKVTQSELKNKILVRKSIYAKKSITKGERFTKDNICLKRPGSGISPSFWEEILEQKAKQNFNEDEQIII